MKEILTVSIAIAAIILGGCSSMNKAKIQAQPTREEVKQEILSHLQEKYGEAFECQSIEYKSWAQSEHEDMFAYPKGGKPNDNFAVYRYDNGERYEDGYVGFVMEKIYQEKIEGVVKKYFPESVIRSGFNNRYIYPESFQKDMDFQTFCKYANKKNSIGIGIYVSAEAESDVLVVTVDKLQNELEKIFAVGGFSIIGYTLKDFEEYIINDPFHSIEEDSSFSNMGEVFSIDKNWGQIDFDYKYKEGD